MKIEIEEPMQLSRIDWNVPSKGQHKLTFSPAPQVIHGNNGEPQVVNNDKDTVTMNLNTASLRILRKPFETTDLWVLRVHFAETPSPAHGVIPARWEQVGIFSSWKAARARVGAMVGAGQEITNDAEGKAWDIKRWDLEH